MKILIVDDDRGNRESMSRFLGIEGFTTRTAENGLAGQRLLETERYDAVVLDVRMPEMTGLQLLEWIETDGPRVPVLMVSAYGEVRDAVEAMKLGAADYIVKPIDPDELTIKIRRAVEIAGLTAALETGKAEELPPLGTSAEMCSIAHTIARVAPTPSTVLITGESGTGKEVVARAIHRSSINPDEPFIPVNLGGIPETLMESELFGYEKGAFTGADSRRIGMFEVAKNGTLFLDEVGELPGQLQVKLLRALQDRKIRRLGGTTEVPVDARIVAATNRDLESDVAQGAFREDLYYRLNVVRIEIPPLRERHEDIPLIAGHLLARINKRLGKHLESITPEAILKLSSYRFPGNIRELENIVERAAIFADGDRIEARDVVLGESNEAPLPVARSLRSVEREAIIVALRRWEGNRTRAAEELGISRRNLQYKIKEYGIEDQKPE